MKFLNNKVFKRVVALLLVGITILSVGIVSIFAESEDVEEKETEVVEEPVLKSFSDVTKDHWAYSAIMSMAKSGIINGTSHPDVNGVATFSPQATMQRAQFIAILTRELYTEEVEEAKVTVPWYNREIAIAKEHGLIKASDFNKKYEENCTREEMAYLLYNAATLMEETLTEAKSENVPDFEDIKPEYQTYVLQAIGSGLINGREKHVFDPKGDMTRAEAAAVIYRLIEESQRVDTSWSLK